MAGVLKDRIDRHRRSVLNISLQAMFAACEYVLTGRLFVT